MTLPRKTFLFLAMNAGLFGIWLLGSGWALRGYHPGNTGTMSLLLAIPEGEDIPVVLLGTSRAKDFSTCDNHRRVEDILGSRLVNLGKETGAGVLPMRLALTRFYEKGNRAAVVLYFLDPFVLYSRKWNEGNLFLEHEPLDGKVLHAMARLGFDREVFIQYFQGKFDLQWFNSLLLAVQSRHGLPWFIPEPTPYPAKVGEENFLTGINPDAIAMRNGVIYPDGLEDAAFSRYSRELVALLELARENGSRVVIVSPPTLLGPQPGMAGMQAFLAGLPAELAIRVFDLSGSIPEPEFYADHDHLNTRGVERFTRDFLKPILAGGRPQVQPNHRPLALD